MPSGTVRLAVAAVQAGPKGGDDMKKLEKGIKNDPSVMSAYPVKKRKK